MGITKPARCHQVVLLRLAKGRIEELRLYSYFIALICAQNDHQCQGQNYVT